MPAGIAGATLLRDWAAAADGAPQATVAAAGLLLGSIVANYGYSLVKPLFVLSCAGACSLQAYILCRETPNKHLVVWAPAVSAAVGLISLKFWNLAYPGFLFIVGCAMGGVCVFAAASAFLVGKEPIALLGATVLGALLFGLSFVRFHNIYWRLLLPPTGGLLAAAGLRYFSAALASPDARWREFTLDMLAGSTVVFGVTGAIFWTSWMVSALLGWYLQLAPLAGLREEPSLLPEWAPRLFPCIFGPDGVLGPGRAVAGPPPPARAARKGAGAGRGLPQLPGSLEPAGEPLLGSRHAAEDTDLQARPPASSRELAAEAVRELAQADYRPEVALLVAALSIGVLNWLLASKPVLFLGHAVLMSMAFLLLVTAGMVSYAARDLLLPCLFGPQSSVRLPRHLTHGAFNGLALGCALAGYGCIYANHAQVGASQFGLDRGNSWSRTLHSLIGYVVLFLMLIQALSGIFKLYTLALFGKKRAAFHHRLGRAVYCLAAANQLIAYTFPGLLPNWATPVLASMLMATVGTTLFFLEEKNRLAVVVKNNSEKALKKIAEATNALPKIPSRENSSAALEAAVLAIARENKRLILQKVFIEWNRIVQQKQLQDASVALEGQDRLVQFLSQELVDGVASDRRQSSTYASESPGGLTSSFTSHQASNRSQ